MMMKPLLLLAALTLCIGTLHGTKPFFVFFLIKLKVHLLAFSELFKLHLTVSLCQCLSLFILDYLISVHSETVRCGGKLL